MSGSLTSQQITTTKKPEKSPPAKMVQRKFTVEISQRTIIGRNGQNVTKN